MFLSQEIINKIDYELTKYPKDKRQSAIMSALAIAQDEYGWLPIELQKEIADYIGMPAIAVQEITTFYKMYNTRPVGKYKIIICTNLPCALSGAEHAAKHLKCKLGVDYKDITDDGKFTIIEGECMGACGDAPVMLINNKHMCSWMTNNKIDTLLEELKNDLFTRSSY